LVATRLLAELGLADSPAAWAQYIADLVKLSGDLAEQKRQGFETLSRGWAIGTATWRRTLAREHSHLILDPSLATAEAREIKTTCWQDELNRVLQERAKTREDVAADPKGAHWKIEIASHLRQTVAAPYRWIAKALNTGSPLATRVNVCRHSNR
jgi:hypothetical protein